MDNLHHHFGSRPVWETWTVDKAPTFQTLELWCDDEGETTKVETRSVPSLSVDNWLHEPSEKYISTTDHTRMLRLVWIGLDSETCRHSPSTRELQRILETWDLERGYDYARSSFAGVSALPPSPSHPTKQVFTATYHPKLAMAWSHDTETSQTNMVIFAEGEERTEFARTLRSRWSRALVSHAMFPALVCSLVLARELDGTLDEIKTVVRNVEARTGHHRFSTRRQTRPAAGELGSLSAEMSGCSAKLANGSRKLQVVEALNAFMREHLGEEEDIPHPAVETRPKTADSYGEHSFLKEIDEKPRPTTTTTESGPAILTHYLGILGHRAAMQQVDTTYVQQRVQVQIAALFHLIAQQDNAIAFETASATRSIAKDSLQDSSSMKMLALVAMFFLPASFVAALFSAPLFDWDGVGAKGGSIGVATKPQFALFWAVAVPLTVATFLMYAAWIVAQKRRMRRRLRVGDV
ncbi:hypothetical protein QBC47DRAFT_83446 [Echria macrotheca]|uniref:Uncharacterized protein n=1 Tax=Echria macrotheca TaxID=438768 RepID=A0AAJ0B3S5_9PEZI|nr:hypothetical protein QBC47DRAFT_83446 [Echria macrotheca]